jgi:hypothetical protein
MIPAGLSTLFAAANALPNKSGNGTTAYGRGRPRDDGRPGGLVMRPAFRPNGGDASSGRRERDPLRVANRNDQLSAPTEDHVARLDRRRGLLDSG